jgi:hypothetical protein
MFRLESFYANWPMSRAIDTTPRQFLIVTTRSSCLSLSRQGASTDRFNGLGSNLCKTPTFLAVSELCKVRIDAKARQIKTRCLSAIVDTPQGKSGVDACD